MYLFGTSYYMMINELPIRENQDRTMKKLLILSALLALPITVLAKDAKIPQTPPEIPRVPALVREAPAIIQQAYRAIFGGEEIAIHRDAENLVLAQDEKFAGWGVVDQCGFVQILNMRTGKVRYACTTVFATSGKKSNG